MANLLPPDSLRQLRRARRARYLFVAGTLAAVLACIAALALVPSYVTLALGITSFTAQPVQSSTSASSTGAITEVRDFAALMNPFFDASTTPSQTIRRAIALRPPGVIIDSIVYTRTDGSGELRLGGSATSAASIASYQHALAGDPSFSQVSVPIGSLAGATNGSFLITLTGAF